MGNPRFATTPAGVVWWRSRSGYRALPSRSRRCQRPHRLGQYSADVIEIGSRARKLPARPSVVWDSLVQPQRPGTRPWLNLLSDEVEPRILDAERPNRVVWSSLWPSRPNDEVHLELAAVGSETSLKFILLTPDATPDPSKTGHLRCLLNHLLFADLRYSYGQ
jgi:hypothetical protein